MRIYNYINMYKYMEFTQETSPSERDIIWRGLTEGFINN